MQLFYCKDEARVKKISSKFCISQPSANVKIIKRYREETVLDLWQSWSYYFSFTQLYGTKYSRMGQVKFVEDGL